MTSETIISLTIIFMLFIGSERLISLYQCRQKSMESFWAQSLSQQWGPQPVSKKYSFSDQCNVLNSFHFETQGQGQWRWGNSSLSLRLLPGVKHE